MAGRSEAIKRVLSTAIVVGVAYFFYRAVRRNWSDIQAAKLEFDYPLLAAAALFVLIGYLLSTYAWQASINGLSETRKLSFSQSVAAVNASGLTKYLPGKFWSYALQMYWLGGAGFSKSLVVYVNLVNLALSIITTLVLGCLGLLFCETKIPTALCWAAFGAVLLLDLAIIRFYSPLFSALITLVNRVFKREIRYFNLPLGLSLWLHAVYFASAIASGISTYLVCLGVGYSVSASDAARVVSSSLISDVVGFLAFVVPAGLGVRESVMFLILDGIALGALPLVLPIASRSVMMLVDVALGLFALKLLKKYAAAGWTSP